MGMLYAGRQVQEPGPVLDTCRLLGFPTDWAPLANRFENPLGTRSGRGYILMLRGDLDVLSGSGLLNQPNDLLLSDTTRTIPIKNLHVVSTRCVTPGYPNDPAAVHLVELADSRRLMAMGEANVAFNLRATPGGNYADSTVLTASTAVSPAVPYSWAQVWARVWVKFKGIYGGDTPALPATPDGTPEGFDFFGWRPADAVGYLLDRMGMALARDPFADTYSVVQAGATQPGLADAETSALSVRMADAEPVAGALGAMPETIAVYFRKAGSWETAYATTGGFMGDGPFYRYVISATTAGATAFTGGLTEILFDDLPALMRANEIAPLDPANAADLAARALARATDFVRIRQAFQNQGYRKVYTGFLGTFTTGSQVRSVAWQDLAGGEHGGGPLTIVDRTPYVPDRFADWSEAVPGGGGGDDGRPGIPEHPWWLVGIADPNAFPSGAAPPTGYEDYTLKAWNPHASVNQNDSIINIWRPSWTQASGFQPGREVAIFSAYRDGRPVYVTIGPSYAGSCTLTAAPIAPLALATFTDALTAPSSGLYLLTGYVLLSSTATTARVTAQIGSTGAATFRGTANISGVGVGTSPVVVPVNCLIEVTTAPAKITIVIANQGAVNNLTVASTDSLQLARL